MARKKQKDDLSAISNSFKKQKPEKNLEEIKKIAKGSAKPPKRSPTPPAAVQEDQPKKLSHRTTINLEIDTYKSAKKHCIDIGKTLTDYISDLIKQDLG